MRAIGYSTQSLFAHFLRAFSWRSYLARSDFLRAIGYSTKSLLAHFLRAYSWRPYFSMCTFLVYDKCLRGYTAPGYQIKSSVSIQNFKLIPCCKRGKGEIY